jgi:hypothetical protein
MERPATESRNMTLIGSLKIHGILAFSIFQTDEVTWLENPCFKDNAACLHNIAFNYFLHVNHIISQGEQICENKLPAML